MMKLFSENNRGILVRDLNLMLNLKEVYGLYQQQLCRCIGRPFL